MPALCNERYYIQHRRRMFFSLADFDICMSSYWAETINMLTWISRRTESTKKNVMEDLHAHLFNITVTPYWYQVSDTSIIYKRRPTNQTFVRICEYFRRPAMWMIPLFLSLPKCVQITSTHFLYAHCVFLWFPVILCYCIFLLGLSWW